MQIIHEYHRNVLFHIFTLMLKYTLFQFQSRQCHQCFFDAFTVFARLSVPFCQCEISKVKDTDMLPRKMNSFLNKKVTQVQVVLSSISSLADPVCPSYPCAILVEAAVASEQLRQTWQRRGCVNFDWVAN